MKNSIKNLATKAVKNIQTIKGGEDDNLVPNGSFESVGKKPKRLGSIAE